MRFFVVLENQHEVAELLGVCFTSARALIDEDGFPIVERGTRGRSYKFDPVAVAEWYRRRQRDIERERQSRSEYLANLKRELFA